MAAAKKSFRYQQLAEEIEHQIIKGTYRPGERLPSIRKLHRQFNLSISTIYHAYMELEAMGMVEARPRSGYYVNPVSLRRLQSPSLSAVSQPPQEVKLSAMINSVIAAISNPHLVPLGSTVTDSELLPYKFFARTLKGLTIADAKALISYSPSEGLPSLRRQIALRQLGLIAGITADDVIVTNGCMEAIALSLLAITRPGDTVAVETPTNFGFLQLLKELGLLVVEVAAEPRHGLDIEELEKIIGKNPVKACLLVPNFHNPTGAIMPDEAKKKLVELTNGNDIPIIEDDISAELFFKKQRPAPLKAFDRKDLIVTCSSFSKTLAPGLRIGWLVPAARFKEKIQNVKAATTVATSTLDQHLLAQYLSGGAYERHLRRLRGALKKQMLRSAVAIQKHFPSGTRLVIPGGGTLLWIQLPPPVDSVQLYRRALERQVAIIPGEVCSNTGQFKNFIQISCGAPVTEKIERGIAILGELTRQMAQTPH